MKDSPQSSWTVSWMVTCVVVSDFIARSPHKSMQKWSVELGVLHLTIEGPGDVILASVCNWTQQYWHETVSQSMCFVVGMISGSFVSWQSSLFTWMCSLLQLPILAKGMLVTAMHRLSSGVLKLGLHGHHGSGKRVVAQPHPIHWPVNDSLRNSHTVREKCTGALSCWNDTCYIIPFLLGCVVTYLHI